MDLELGGSEMDIATDQGFANSLYKACNMKEGGTALVAPVCGSFVFMRFGANEHFSICPRFG